MKKLLLLSTASLAFCAIGGMNSIAHAQEASVRIETHYECRPKSSEGRIREANQLNDPGEKFAWYEVTSSVDANGVREIIGDPKLVVPERPCTSVQAVTDFQLHGFSPPAVEAPPASPIPPPPPPPPPPPQGANTWPPDVTMIKVEENSDLTYYYKDGTVVRKNRDGKTVSVLPPAVKIDPPKAIDPPPPAKTADPPPAKSADPSTPKQRPTGYVNPPPPAPEEPGALEKIKDCLKSLIGCEDDATLKKEHDEALKKSREERRTQSKSDAADGRSLPAKNPPNAPSIGAADHTMRSVAHDHREATMSGLSHEEMRQPLAHFANREGMGEIHMGGFGQMHGLGAGGMAMGGFGGERMGGLGGMHFGGLGGGFGGMSGFLRH